MAGNGKLARYKNM